MPHPGDSIASAYAEGLSRNAPIVAEAAGDLQRVAKKELDVSDKTMAVKFADGSDNIIEGLAIPYGGLIGLGNKDLHGEDFGPDTDLALDWFPNEGRPFLFHHGMDDTVKTTLVGRQIEREERDIGQWVKVQLDKRNRHYEAIAQLVAQDGLSFSSGSLPHLVQTRKDGHIQRWPWIELSGTPTEANPLAAVYAVKMADAIEHIAAAKAEVPEALKQAIDEWAGPEPDLPARIEAASAEVRHLVDQSRQHANVRAKAGRVLSAANRERLAQHLARIEELRTDLRELIEQTDPEQRARKDREFLQVLALTH